MPTLLDIKQFGSLKSRSEDFKLLGISGSLELHGGAAFRFALRLHACDYKLTSPIDLFDLSPFTSDVDILHSGENTNAIVDYIQRHIENAGCFRWEIRSKIEHEIFEKAENYSSQIPARRIILSEDELIDPLGGLEDIKSRYFRYKRSRKFKKSPLFAACRDLEVFSALLYLQTLFEANLNEEEMNNQPGTIDIKNILHEFCCADTHDLLFNNPYLRSRLCYLLINCFASASDSNFNIALKSFGLGYFLDFLISIRIKELSEIAKYCQINKSTSSRALCSSAIISKSYFRLPVVTSPDLTIATLMKKRNFLKNLGLNQYLLKTGVPIAIRRGSPHSNTRSSIGTAEFIHFWLPKKLAPTPETLKDFDDSDLSGLVRIQPQLIGRLLPLRLVAHSIPCIVQRPRDANGAVYKSGVFIRINMLGLLEYLNHWPFGTALQFCLVAQLNNQKIEGRRSTWSIWWNYIKGLIRPKISAK